MKNKLVYLLIGVVLLLVGFTLGHQYKSTTPVTNTTNTQLAEDDVFARKIECQKYQSNIEKKLSDSDITVPETGAQTFNTFNKVFYSPKVNSCLYVSTDVMFVNGKKTSEIPTLRDALSGETLLSGIREWGADDYFDRVEQFETGVKDYE